MKQDCFIKFVIGGRFPGPTPHSKQDNIDTCMQQAYKA
jgi:hypothetical protein